MTSGIGLGSNRREDFASSCCEEIGDERLVDLVEGGEFVKVDLEVGYMMFR